MFRRLFQLALVVLSALAIWLCWGLLLPVTPNREQVIMLRAGWSARRIAAELKNQGVIRSRTAFLLYHYVVRPRSLKAGEYKFDQAAGAVKVHERLVRGDIFRRTVVIP